MDETMKVVKWWMAAQLLRRFPAARCAGLPPLGLDKVLAGCVAHLVFAPSPSVALEQHFQGVTSARGQASSKMGGWGALPRDVLDSVFALLSRFCDDRPACKASDLIAGPLGVNRWWRQCGREKVRRRSDNQARLQCLRLAKHAR